MNAYLIGIQQGKEGKANGGAHDQFVPIGFNKNDVAHCSDILHISSICRPILQFCLTPYFMKAGKQAIKPMFTQFAPNYLIITYMGIILFENEKRTGLIQARIFFHKFPQESFAICHQGIEFQIILPLHLLQ